MSESLAIFETESSPNQEKLRREYDWYYEVRALITKDLESMTERILSELPSRPSVKGRVKDFSSYFKKYLLILKNANKHESICQRKLTDVIGLRVICLFIEDLAGVERLIRESFEVIEVERKGKRYSFKEFGYESTHLLIKIPPEIVRDRGDPAVDVAEIQIRTILQDAWAEVEHELIYKAEFNPLDEPMKRKLAAINASLSLADTVFQEIRDYQRQLLQEMGKRRDSFFRKIENEIDVLLFENEESENEKEKDAFKQSLPLLSGESIDDLLLTALYAHNQSQYKLAIACYSRILELDPEENAAAVIYKHRGMANFAQSCYEDAIEDFSAALRMDPGAYKAAYFRGVVHSVLGDYEAAIEDYNLALDIEPYHAFCHYRRGQAYYHLEDIPQALGDCEAALALDPENESFGKFAELLRSKLKM